MISKELFSEILGYRVKWIQETLDDENTLIYDTSKYTNIGVNIHELSHLCKKWACTKMFHTVSWTILYEAVDKKGYAQLNHTQKDISKPFHADTEYEAIFNACEWILKDNK